MDSIDIVMAQAFWSSKRIRVKSGQKTKLRGSNSPDYLIGGKNKNKLLGGPGSDILDGRGGSDTLTGGRGADYFVISEGDDVVTDFNPNEGDQIVHATHDDIIRFPYSGGTLLTTIQRDIYTIIETVSPSEVSIHSQQRLKPTFKVVFANGKKIKLESANTPFQRSLGMMQREPLPKKRGMMFPLEKIDQASVYMFNCLAPLDIVFLKQGAIVGLSEKTPICKKSDPDLCPLYESPEKVDHWLEFREGTIQRMGLAVGDLVEISPL